jgi:hypothetical protein
MDLSKASIL